MAQLKNTRARTQYLVKLAILAAILFFLEVTGLGYIRIPIISMTIMQVPVIIGAIVLGPAAGAVLGAVFGLTSFWQAVSGKDPVGSILLSQNPFGLVVTTIPTRILMGWLCGVIYQALRRTRLHEYLRLIFASLSGALLNTLLFMGMFILFFFRAPVVQDIATSLGTDIPLRFAFLLVGVQGLVEAGICAVLGSAVSRALIKYSKAST